MEKEKTMAMETMTLSDILEELEVLGADHGDAVQEAVRLAREQPLSQEEARALYERVLTILRTAGQKLTANQRKALAKEIEVEVSRIMAARDTESADDQIRRGGLVFRELNGLKPRDVTPIPSYNGVSVPMFEGYVDVTTLRLWKDNHRVELFVSEFEQINGRHPEDEELLLMLQGELVLPSAQQNDPFRLRPLAGSIARKGVERPPIVTWDGEPKDGNRRIAASMFVLSSDKYGSEEKERARWIRVWQAPEGTTNDQFEAIVVALNFEDDHKEEWPEYIKARLVTERYDHMRTNESGRWTTQRAKAVRVAVASQFAIDQSDVKRYLDMMRWADDFVAYHVEDRGLDESLVRHKANRIFQWFYEIQAGRGTEKVTNAIEQDDDLKAIVYDLMFDVLDSGLQVRSIHQVIAMENGVQHLEEAHEMAEEDADKALGMVESAILEAKASKPTRKVGFEKWVRTQLVKRLGATQPNTWADLDSDLLLETQKVLRSAIGAVDGELKKKGAGS